MKFTVVVNAHPESAAALSARRFCTALLAQKHTLYRLFFYGEGVINGAVKPGSELSRSWSRLIEENGIDAVCCVGSAKQRGIDSEANLEKGFTISGLGQMIDGVVNSDRLVTFGKRVSFA